MWKFFVLLAAIAGYRLWHMDHAYIAALAVLVGIIAFWSAGVMDNIARASRNYTGAPQSKLEVIAITVNMVASLAGLGLLVLSFFLK